MDEYIANGAQLGWRIGPQARRVYVYRPNVVVEVLENRVKVSGELVLPGLVLNLQPI